MDRRSFIQKLAGATAVLVTPNFLQIAVSEPTLLKNPDGGILMTRRDERWQQDKRFQDETFVHTYVHEPTRKEIILGTVFRYVNNPNQNGKERPAQNIYVSTFLKPMILEPTLPDWMVATTSGGSGRKFDFYVLAHPSVQAVYVKFLYQEPDIDYTRIWNNA